MTNWELSITDKYERKYKQYEKKHPNELTAIISNLDIYFKHKFSRTTLSSSSNIFLS